MSFATRLTALRKERKIAQNVLAKTVGVHANVLGRYERAEANPSIEMALKLADALGVSLDYLAGSTDMELDKSIVNKILAIQQLPEEDQHCIMYSIDGLIHHAKTRQAYAS